MRCGSGKRTRSSTSGPTRARVRGSRKINVMRTPICSGPSAQAVTPAPPSSCRTPTLRRCANTSKRSAEPSRPVPTPWSFSTKLAVTPRANSRSRKTSPWCRCRRHVRNSTPRRTSGNTCARPISPTGCSKATPTFSMPARTPGESSSTRPGESPPSLGAIGQPPVNQYEGWYNTRSDRYSVFKIPGVATDH
jgi:hypothetical protein